MKVAVLASDGGMQYITISNSLTVTAQVVGQWWWRDGLAGTATALVPCT